MNDMTLFLDLILMASGAYCMYTFLRLAVTKRLFKNGLLVPKEKKISDCADEPLPMAAGNSGGGAGLARMVRHPQFPCKPRLFRYVANMARSRYGSGPRVKFYP